MTICGETKTSAFGSVTLVCNLDSGHELPHGVRESPNQPPYVRWPVARTVQDATLQQERAGWRKPHKRGKYQTLAMWKAANL